MSQNFHDYFGRFSTSHFGQFHFERPWTFERELTVIIQTILCIGKTKLPSLHFKVICWCSHLFLGLLIQIDMSDQLKRPKNKMLPFAQRGGGCIIFFFFSRNPHKRQDFNIKYSQLTRERMWTTHQSDI